MTTRQELIAEARTFIGTPWQHQGVLKGLGCDCEGFLEGVARNTALPVLVEVIRNYRRHEDGSMMLRLLNEGLEFVAAGEGREPPDMSLALPADVLAFCDEQLREPDKPRHLGLLTQVRHDGVCYVIHASERGVIEHRLDLKFLRRIHSIWRIPNLSPDE